MLFNISGLELNSLYRLLNDCYESKLFLLKNKKLVNYFIEVNLYNKLAIIESTTKNKYFFTNNLIYLIKNLNMHYKLFKLILFFNNKYFIDINIINNYINNTIYKLPLFFIKINNIFKNLITTISCNFNYIFYYNILKIIYVFILQYQFLIRLSYFKHNNII